MPLAPRLWNVMLRHSCPHCGNTTERKGSFFNRATHYTCTSCAKRVPLTSPEKQRLFTASTRCKPL